jgi:uncharacterized protein
MSEPRAPGAPGAQAADARPLTARVLAAIVLTSSHRPLVTVAVSLVLAAAAIAYTVTTLTFVTSNLRLLPQHERYVVLLKEYQRDFGELNDIVVVVESPTPDRSKAYAARLVATLEEQGLAASRIAYRVDPAYFAGRGLLYLSVDQLTKLRDTLFDYQEFIETYAARPTLPTLLQALNRQIASAMMVGFIDLGFGGRASPDLDFVNALLDQIGGALDGDVPYVSPWAAAFSLGRLDDPDVGYFFSSDRQWLFVFVKQRREEGTFADSRGTIEAMRQTIGGLRRDFPDVHAGVTGGPTISNDEMVTALDDSTVATLLALGLTMALLLAAFRRPVKPILMVATLVVSLGWSLGLVTLVIGHLSIFSVMFISIVVGIGIDYGIYFLFRYQEERTHGLAPAEALRVTAERTGPGMLLGALTAAGAFFVLTLTDFQGIREFGVVAGVAILMAFLAMITLFPALAAFLDRRGAPTRPAASRRGAADDHAWWLEHLIRPRRAIVVTGLVVTALAMWGAAHVRFDYNMLKLQAKGVESVAWEQRILARAGRSGFTALATASTPDELRHKHDAFAALPSVAKVESALTLVPERQAEKVKLIEQVAPLLAPVRVGATTPLEPAELGDPLRTLRRRLGLAVAESGDEARRVVEPVLAKAAALLDKLGRADRRRAAPALRALQQRIAVDFGDRLATLQSNLVPRVVEAGTAPPEIRHRYVGTSGRYMLRIHPAVDIWERAGAERFVTDLRGVDPEVTGPPITSFEAIRLIRQGYVQGTIYALVLVTLVALAVLRSARGTALALSPLALGVVWTLGVMQVIDLEFNLANVWALPLIIGTAAEFGLNIFLRFREGEDTGGPTLAQSTVMAVALNGLTTMAGFASLMVAHHRGIFGLGLLLTVGMTASLIASLAVLPALLRIVAARGSVGNARVRGQHDVGFAIEQQDQRDHEHRKTRGDPGEAAGRG